VEDLMDNSTGKTLALVAVILLVLLIAWPLRYILMAPVGIVHSLADGFHGRPHFRGDFWAWPWLGFAGLFVAAALIFWLVVIIWVYRDAEKHGLSGPLWAVIVFFVHVVGLLIYLLVRSDHPIPAPAPAPAPQAAPPRTCPKCGRTVEPSHAYCPFCGRKL
jgi:hypothetical protein